VRPVSFCVWDVMRMELSLWSAWVHFAATDFFELRVFVGCDGRNFICMSDVQIRILSVLIYRYPLEAAVPLAVLRPFSWSGSFLVLLVYIGDSIYTYPCDLKLKDLALQSCICSSVHLHVVCSPKSLVLAMLPQYHKSRRKQLHLGVSSMSSITTTRILLFATLACLTTFIYYDTFPHSSIMSSSSSSPSRFSHWHTRTHSHPFPHNFTPTLSSLRFLVARSTQVEPEGFTVAFFTPNIAVDARGRVLELTSSADFDGITELAKQTTILPDTGLYLNTWRVKQARTEQPFERLHVPIADGEVKTVSVQGYDGVKRLLDEPVEGIVELPDVLWELIELVLEARKDYVRGEEDKEVIEKVKAVLKRD